MLREPLPFPTSGTWGANAQEFRNLTTTVREVVRSLRREEPVPLERVPGVPLGPRWIERVRLVDYDAGYKYFTGHRLNPDGSAWTDQPVTIRALTYPNSGADLRECVPQHFSGDDDAKIVLAAPLPIQYDGADETVELWIIWPYIETCYPVQQLGQNNFDLAKLVHRVQLLEDAAAEAVYEH